MNKPDGIVMLNTGVVGKFKLDDRENIQIEFDRGSAGVRESLEYAAEQGMTFALQLQPDYDGEG